MKKENAAYNPKSGFKTPNDYFEGLEDKILTSANLSAKLEDKRSAGFKIPDGYFDSLDDNLQQKLIKKEPKVKTLINREVLLYAASIAAIFIAFASTFYFTPETQTSWENLELSVMENYIDNNNINFSTREISNYIFQQGYIVDETDLNAINSEEMNDYFDENIEDLYVLD